jgi:hypothetical protein
MNIREIKDLIMLKKMLKSQATTDRKRLKAIKEALAVFEQAAVKNMEELAAGVPPARSVHAELDVGASSPSANCGAATLAF